MAWSHFAKHISMKHFVVDKLNSIRKLWPTFSRRNCVVSCLVFWNIIWLLKHGFSGFLSWCIRGMRNIDYGHVRSLSVGWGRKIYQVTIRFCDAVLRATCWSFCEGVGNISRGSAWLSRDPTKFPSELHCWQIYTLAVNIPALVVKSQILEKWLWNILKVKMNLYIS